MAWLVVIRRPVDRRGPPRTVRRHLLGDRQIEDVHGVEVAPLDLSDIRRRSRGRSVLPSSRGFVRLKRRDVHHSVTPGS